MILKKPMELKRTSLYKRCLSAGGKMTPFAGWEMPIQFAGLIQEHQAVRNKAGVFDISHMGAILISGENAKKNLQGLIPSDLYRIDKGEACYTVLLNDSAGIIDDLIIYDQGFDNNGIERLLLIINAACIESDLTWLKTHLDLNKISIKEAKGNGILLAIQGPIAESILESILNQSLKEIPRFGHASISLECSEFNKAESIFISRTGYTGEEGFEILLGKYSGNKLWEQLLEKGVSPCGLGARDTLRLEAGMHLYGNEMDEKTTPFEAGLGWLVHLEMPHEFIGRAVLEKQVERGIAKKLIGLKVEGRAIARKGYPIFYQDTQVGTVTSGTWSPTLKEAIAMAYVPIELSTPETPLFVEIRGKKYPSRVVRRPFYKKN